MTLGTKIAGFAAFGVAVRAWALGIQRRPVFERMYQCHFLQFTWNCSDLPVNGLFDASSSLTIIFGGPFGGILKAQ